MFDVGQKVICVRKEPWMVYVEGVNMGIVGDGPRYLEECLVTDSFCFYGHPHVCIENWNEEHHRFGARNFRPKEPNIEALRSLITKLPVKQPEKV